MPGFGVRGVVIRSDFSGIGMESTREQSIALELAKLYVTDSCFEPSFWTETSMLQSLEVLRKGV